MFEQLGPEMKYCTLNFLREKHGFMHLSTIQSFIAKNLTNYNVIYTGTFFLLAHLPLGKGPGKLSSIN